MMNQNSFSITQELELINYLNNLKFNEGKNLGHNKNLTNFSDSSSRYNNQNSFVLENQNNTPGVNQHTNSLYDSFIQSNTYPIIDVNKQNQDLHYNKYFQHDSNVQNNLSNLLIWLQTNLNSIENKNTFSNNNSQNVNSLFSQMNNFKTGITENDLSQKQECLSESSLPSTVYSDSIISEMPSYYLSKISTENFSLTNSQNQKLNFLLNDGSNQKVNKLLPSLTKRLEKTQLCRHFTKNYRCANGKNCAFAHSIEELKNRPNLAKTKLCSDYQMGFCIFGANCKHAHSDSELKATPEFYKTSLCPEFTRYFYCNKGTSCRFAHSELELKRIH